MGVGSGKNRGQGMGEIGDRILTTTKVGVCYFKGGRGDIVGYPRGKGLWGRGPCNEDNLARKKKRNSVSLGGGLAQQEPTFI